MDVGAPVDLGVDVGVDLGVCSASGATCGGNGAVSYTHLRAHETVLDLVCRLLLEKKNLLDI